MRSNVASPRQRSSQGSSTKATRRTKHANDLQRPRRCVASAARTCSSWRRPLTPQARETNGVTGFGEASTWWQASARPFSPWPHQTLRSGPSRLDRSSTASLASFVGIDDRAHDPGREAEPRTTTAPPPDAHADASVSNEAGNAASSGRTPQDSCADHIKCLSNEDPTSASVAVQRCSLPRRPRFGEKHGAVGASPQAPMHTSASGVSYLWALDSLVEESHYGLQSKRSCGRFVGSGASCDANPKLELGASGGR